MRGGVIERVALALASCTDASGNRLDGLCLPESIAGCSDDRCFCRKVARTAIAAMREREIMLERQREGIAKAKAEGKYKGRKPTVVKMAEQIRAMRAEGIGPTKIARRLSVARSSVYRILESFEGTQE